MFFDTGVFLFYFVCFLSELGTFWSSLANFLSRVWTWSDGVKLIHSNSQRRRRLLYFLFIYTKNLPRGIAKHWFGVRTANNCGISRLFALRNAHRCILARFRDCCSACGVATMVKVLKSMYSAMVLFDIQDSS